MSGKRFCCRHDCWLLPSASEACLSPLECLLYHKVMRMLGPVSVFLVLLPLQAQQAPAGPSASSRPRTKSVDAGTVTNGVYRNSSFGFTYKIPFGWVERTEQMRDDSTDPAKGQVLLAVFERPPEVSGKGMNSGVVIAAESISIYPGLRTAVDYFGPLTELTTAKGFTVANEPYEFELGGRKLVRADYIRQRGQEQVHQSSLAMLSKGFVVSFTMIGVGEDDIEELAGGLSFGSPSPKPSR